MKNILVILALALFAGCLELQTIGAGAPVTDIAVSVAPGYSLYDAMVSAANRRRWTVAKNDNGTYRLSIIQRNNRCVVDVVLNGNESFSILPVESTITVRKYDQWVNNLQREIIHRATR